MCVCVCVYVCVYVRAYVRACVCVCVKMRERGGWYRFSLNPQIYTNGAVSNIIFANANKSRVSIKVKMGIFTGKETK